ncbi:hypothetical protein [Streptomyces cyaneochromogenes]|uniref:hypothetical protein n=1 Tax=Streptomyces cyaneochromogenes TaxID=2496836 RepID=UPI001588C762|nr:hypothetical protein [Streptomyces cyaneochromogenes]
MNVAARRQLVTALIRNTPAENVRRELRHTPSASAEHYVRSADAAEPDDDEQDPETR